jgi:Na+-transporting methylmalonyl-CoA/oxaloacetate decarboxylase gamma subunit
MMSLAMWNVESFGDAALLSILCILVVFLVLIVISLILTLINKIRVLDVKETVKMKDGTELDEDAMAAVLVATLDYRKERKEDVKVISCKLIDDEKKNKNK